MKILLYYFLFCLMCGTSFAQEPLTVAAALPAKPYAWIEDNKPESNNMVGVGMDILHAFFDELKIELQPKIYPWARSLHYAKSGEIDALLTIFYTKARAEFMEFPEHYLDIDVCVIVPKGKIFKFEKWDDLIGKRGIGIRGDSQGNEFDNFDKTTLNIFRVTDIKQAFAMLVHKDRMDYLIYVRETALIDAAKLGYSDKIEILPVPVTSQKLYITFAKKSKYAKYVPALSKKIKLWKSNGKIKEWYNGAMKKCFQ
ncbi:MAG: amino acid ABC transporter substrate-binding protein [Desulfobacteraceae bacterium]|nr:amino acid ABC transporter substrate-binding protein [Desulfobacteraceae bacterium]